MKMRRIARVAAIMCFRMALDLIFRSQLPVILSSLQLPSVERWQTLHEIAIDWKNHGRRGGPSLYRSIPDVSIAGDNRVPGSDGAYRMALDY